MRLAPKSHKKHRATKLGDYMGDKSVWKEISALVKKRDGNKCRICGMTSVEAREKGSWLEVHHITSLKRGGTDDMKNLVTLCQECHLAQPEHGRKRK